MVRMYGYESHSNMQFKIMILKMHMRECVCVLMRCYITTKAINPDSSYIQYTNSGVLKGGMNSNLNIIIQETLKKRNPIV